jgi:hypothetical protein
MDATRSLELIKVKTEQGVTPIGKVAQIRVTRWSTWDAQRAPAVSRALLCEHVMLVHLDGSGTAAQDRVWEARVGGQVKPHFRRVGGGDGGSDGRIGHAPVEPIRKTKLLAGDIAFLALLRGRRVPASHNGREIGTMVSALDKTIFPARGEFEAGGGVSQENGANFALRGGARRTLQRCRLRSLSRGGRRKWHTAHNGWKVNIRKLDLGQRSGAWDSHLVLATQEEGKVHTSATTLLPSALRAVIALAVEEPAVLSVLAVASVTEFETLSAADRSRASASGRRARRVASPSSTPNLARRLLAVVIRAGSAAGAPATAMVTAGL